MLMQTIGLINLEKVERRINPAKLEILKAQLIALKKLRNIEAHTHIKGRTKTLDAPSVTIARFPHIFSALKNFEDELRQL